MKKINFLIIKFLILTGSSGCGKGTEKKYLMEEYPSKFIFSISATSRPPGQDEVEGKDYFFMSEEEFKKKIAEGYFIEYQYVSGNWYGTPKSQLEQDIPDGKVLLMDIEVKGAKNIKEMFGEKVFIAFITLGDNVENYKKRILARNRKSDTEDAIKERLARIPEELKIGETIFDAEFSNLAPVERLFRNIDDVVISKLFPGVKPLSLLEAKNAQ